MAKRKQYGLAVNSTDKPCYNSARFENGGR